MKSAQSSKNPKQIRHLDFSRLEKESFDLLIIGGGITGCGIARDAALRGLSVALVEKSDFASGTSSKSSKLVHGGLRYLEQGHLRLVFEGTNERALLLRVAPHLVKPLPFLVPAYEGAKNGLFKLDVGLWAYDALSLFSSPKLHRTHFAKRIYEIEPTLRREALKGGIVYYDCMTDDARLTLENAIDARQLGAVMLNYAKVIGLEKAADGKVVGATVQDAEPGSHREVRVKAKVIINATGPWSDEVRAMLGDKRILKPTKGVHLVLDAKKLPIQHALLMNSPRDGRVMFAIPWGERTVLGTTDTFHEGSADEVVTTKEDAEYLLESANYFYPDARVGLDDVISTWAGLRPLVAPESDGLGASDVSREHFLISKPGFITIAGGKLTTYRRIALEVVDEALTQLDRKATSETEDRLLPGANGLVGPRALEELAEGLERQGLTGGCATHLANTYGSRAWDVVDRISRDPSSATSLPSDGHDILACVDEAIENEFSVTLCDVLERRMPLILTDRKLGTEAAPVVARRMAAKLDWSEERTHLELENFEAKVREALSFRVTP